MCSRNILQKIMDDESKSIKIATKVLILFKAFSELTLCF